MDYVNTTGKLFAVLGKCESHCRVLGDCEDVISDTWRDGNKFFLASRDRDEACWMTVGDLKKELRQSEYDTLLIVEGGRTGGFIYCVDHDPGDDYVIIRVDYMDPDTYDSVMFHNPAEA